jgi:uncharacterized coiled-coil protein SlyX
LGKVKKGTTKMGMFSEIAEEAANERMGRTIANLPDTISSLQTRIATLEVRLKDLIEQLKPLFNDFDPRPNKFPRNKTSKFHG